MAELGPQGAALHREVGALARRLGIELLYSFGELAALAAESFGAGAERHRDMDALTQTLRTALGPGVRLLIKGSRVNRLERLVMALSGAPAARPAGRTG